MAEFRQIGVTNIDNVTVVRFRSHKLTDELHVQRFSEELLSLLEDDACKALLLDFDGVELFSSAALGHIIKLHKRSAAKGVKLAFCNIGPTISELFRITGMDAVFQIAPTTDKAMAMLA